MAFLSHASRILQHVSLRPAVAPLQQACRMSFMSEAQLRDVSAVQTMLEDALEGASYIKDSAQQALLEADPSSREPQDSYLARYQTVARDELEAALSHYEALQASLGEEEMQWVQRLEDFKLLKTAADSMLTRDNLNESLRRTSEKLQKNWATCAD